MTSATGPTLATPAGTVRGEWLDGGTGAERVAAFRGVPFAAPPVGALRFDAPRPPEPWTGERPAVAPGPSAPQPHRQFTLIPEPVIPGDDCLQLDVFTSDPGRGAGLPVLVFIHGGGFVAGSNASPWYDGRAFARAGVVVVNISYRLGVEGFLELPDAPTPTNRGALDWLAALTWVHDAIAGAGGDPEQVTLAGQSAGAVSAATLLAMPRAKGLFHRAILMSGAGQGLTPAGDAAGQRDAIAELLGRPVTVASLDAATAEEVAAAVDGYGPLSAHRPELPRLLGPILDGELIPESAFSAARAGRTADVDLVIGCTAEEMTAAASMQAAALADDARYGRRLARAGIDQVRAESYTAAVAAVHPDPPRWRVLGQAATDATFRAPAAALAEARATTGAPAFAYDFRWPSPALGGLGAVHCLDVPFAFDTLDAHGAGAVTGEAAPPALAVEVHGAFVEFVTRGDPGWPRYTVEGTTADRTAMAFDDPSTLVHDPWSTPRRFFGSTPATS